VDVAVALRVHAELGEGPRWDAATRRLLWVDIEGRALHVFDPARGEDRSIVLDARVGAAAPSDDGRVLVALADRLALLDLRDESLQTLARFPHDDRFRTNDGACDANGRLWIGTMELREAPRAGALYRYDGRLERVVEGVTLSNGLGWTPDDTRLYYVDSLEYRVDVFDFDLAAGRLARRRPFVVIAREDGIPDGLAVDDEGGVWLALYGGGCVRRYDANGRIDAVLRMPAENVTACCFGGDDGRSLYVTTAAPDGSVYVADVGVSGPPAHPFHSGDGSKTAPSDADATSAR
jgi:sugar lactone lactonase YvrE